MAYSIYRFRSIQAASDIIKHGAIPLSNPEWFNDPFDASRIIIEKFFNEYIADIRNTINEIFSTYGKEENVSITPEELEILIHMIKENILTKTYIVSFNKNVINPLMWAHYNKYEGVALEFDLRQFSPLIRDGFYDVEYRQYYPNELRHFGNSPNPNIEKTLELFYKSIYDYLLSVKNISWAYEEEIRYISTFQEINQKEVKKHIKEFKDSNERFTKALEFNSDSLKGIYFGLRSHKSFNNFDMESFLDRINMNYSKMDLYMTFPHKSRIEVDFINLSNIHEMKRREEQNEFVAFRGFDVDEIKKLSLIEKIKHISLYYQLSLESDWE